MTKGLPILNKDVQALLRDDKGNQFPWPQAKNLQMNPADPWLNRLRRLITPLLLMALVLALPLNPNEAIGALAEPMPDQRAQVNTVRIGAFLMDLGDLDPTTKSFSASFWLWTVTPKEAGSP